MFLRRPLYSCFKCSQRRTDREIVACVNAMEEQSTESMYMTLETGLTEVIWKLAALSSYEPYLSKVEICKGRVAFLAVLKSFHS